MSTNICKTDFLNFEQFQIIIVSNLIITFVLYPPIHLFLYYIKKNNTNIEVLLFWAFYCVCVISQISNLYLEYLKNCVFN